MAEYLSIGSVDPHTAMWMRDAVFNNNFPTLSDMTKNAEYFPYRFGHAFWAFIGRTFGDSLIVPIFMETAKRGYDVALKRYLGFNEKEFSDIWRNAYIEHYKMMMVDTVDNPAGTKVIDERNGGNINISPAISPDGKYIAFYSEKNLFSIDLFLADAATGKTFHKLSSTLHRNEIDALNFIESAGAWSPDSKYFAYVAFGKGKNKLLVVDIERRRQESKLKFRECHPSTIIMVFHGKSIVVSGLVDGRNELYQYYIEEKGLNRLPMTCGATSISWSPDGRPLSIPPISLWLLTFHRNVLRLLYKYP